MVDMAMISGAMSALKAVSDSAKAMVAIHDASVLRTKVVELNTQIVTAQRDTLAALSDQFALLERVSELEKQVADFKKWETEKQRYEMKIVARGAGTYALKEDAAGAEPPHWICTACYENCKKSIMQDAGPAPHMTRSHVWGCPICKAEIRVPIFASPTHPSHESQM
jgi:rubrerythrin